MKKNSYEKSENSYDRKVEKDFKNILKRDPVKLTDEELRKKSSSFLTGTESARFQHATTTCQDQHRYVTEAKVLRYILLLKGEER
jgi:hypothetical protein